MKHIFLSCAVLTTTLAFAVPAQATLLTRTFVSATGSDSNPCTITQPCASFAHAYSLTAPNGIIAALDPGKYGPLTIIGPITINGNGWSAITAPAAGNGITINAGASDTITLTGLEIDGAGAGYDGIVFNSGGSLIVTNCLVKDFVENGSFSNTTGDGILIQPTSGNLNFIITETRVTNNQFNGIAYLAPSGSPNTKGVIDHVVATANGNGIVIIPLAVSGGKTLVAISNTVASDNGNSGFDIDNSTSGAYLLVSIDNVSATENNTGIIANGTPEVLLGRSVITLNNLYGVQNGVTSNSFDTYKDNRILANNVCACGGADISSPLNAAVALQ
jgi:hypothetical protein